MAEVQVSLLSVVVLRLVIGGGLIWQGQGKVRQGYLQKSVIERTDLTNPFRATLKMWMEDRPVYQSGGRTLQSQTVSMPRGYRVFLERAVLPSARIFAILVTVCELAVGFLLIVGLLVRVASTIGILLCLNYLLATWHYGFPYTTLNLLVITSLLVLLLTGAGRVAGMDAVLHRRYPEIPFF